MKCWFFALLLSLPLAALADEFQSFVEDPFQQNSGEVDYGEFNESIRPPANIDNQFQQPKLGSKGYRSMMIAGGVNLRTPGFGVAAEYSWNRLSMGLTVSQWPRSRNIFLNGFKQSVSLSNYFGVYGAYYLLPFHATPFVMVGVAYSGNAKQSLGPLFGLGAEVRFYGGFFANLSYSYQSIEEDRYPGLGIGYSF